MSALATALVKLGDDIGGSHISFGYDTKENQLVMLQGQMGYGEMYWYGLDADGTLREVRNTGGFTYGMEGQPEYDDIMRENNVAYLPSSSSYSFGDEIRTTIYDGTDAYNVADEFLELSFELLEDYKGHSLLVFSSYWSIDFNLKKNPGLVLSETLSADA